MSAITGDNIQDANQVHYIQPHYPKKLAVPEYPKYIKECSSNSDTDTELHHNICAIEATEEPLTHTQKKQTKKTEHKMSKKSPAPKNATPKIANGNQNSKGKKDLQATKGNRRLFSKNLQNGQQPHKNQQKPSYNPSLQKKNTHSTIERATPLFRE
jgi:hypothetical protein